MTIVSKSDKNIGAGVWRVDNLFEAGDSGDVLVHPRITCGHIYMQIHSLPAGGSVGVVEIEVSPVTLYTKQSPTQRCFIRHYLQDEMKMTSNIF